MAESNGRMKGSEKMSTHALHFFWLFDTSGSMAYGGKIQALNNAIYELIPNLKTFQKENPHIRIMIRAITFSNGARWHIERPTPLDEFQWQEVTAGGLTDMGEAFRLLAEELDRLSKEAPLMPPVLILTSDGQPTDKKWESSLKRLISLPISQRAMRFAIAIGNDADFEVLRKFIGNDKYSPIKANNPEALAIYVQCFTMAVLTLASNWRTSFGKKRLQATQSIPVISFRDEINKFYKG